MDPSKYHIEDLTLKKSASVKKNFRFSFSSFQKAIRENSELRKQIEDIVDLGLFDYLLRRNTQLIQSVRDKAEAESFEIMLQFTRFAGDYQELKKIIHRNRIIRTMAIMDRKAQMELVNRLKRSSHVA